MHNSIDMVKFHAVFDEKSLWVRQQLWEMTMKAKRGHIPSCYSCVDILVTLFYSGIMTVTPDDPDSLEHDRFIMSKGHAAAALYPIFADLGFFPMEELGKYAEPGGILGMYADPGIPGIETVSDSLGHGLGIACGYATADKMDGLDRRTYVMIGDAECNEGSVWESAEYAAQHSLNNITVIIDDNGLGILGETSGGSRLLAKWKAHGWATDRVAYGHSCYGLAKALSKSAESDVGPRAVIIKTIKGMGISFMHGNPMWHNKMPDPTEQHKARVDLKLEEQS